MIELATWQGEIHFCSQSKDKMDLDLDMFRQLAGFDADLYIKRMKDELGIKRGWGLFDNQSSQAMSRHARAEETPRNTSSSTDDYTLPKARSLK